MLSNDLKTKEFEELCFAFSTLKNPEEIKSFLSDICTLKELKDLTERLQVVKRLQSGETYRSIAKSVPSSLATITRVAKWMREGSGGYNLVFERLSTIKNSFPMRELIKNEKLK